MRIEKSNVRKKRVREPPNVTKELSHMMLELHNMRMEPSNVRKKKKKRESLNVTKVQSHVILILYNVRMIPSNARKNNRTIECDKRIVTFDVGLHNVRMKSLNVRKK